jgi:cystathionine gamma-synthase
MESPTNPGLDVADLPAIGKALPESVTFVTDNTFATPLLQRPLIVGAHVVLHATTKSLSGHPDGLMGLLVCRDGDDRYHRLSATRMELGAVPGAMEAYLVLRGVRTLAVRMRQSQENAQCLAERLDAHPAVRRVRYPGLVDDPAHEVAARTMAGYGNQLTIELADAESADMLVEGAHIWSAATGLGGVESLFERRRRWPAALTRIPAGLLRMSVGIEHVEDLWDDLLPALDRLAQEGTGTSARSNRATQ